MASNTYGAIKLSTAEDVGAVLKKKTGSADGYKPKEWADTINLMGLLPVRTASGSIAHFTDGADDVPLKSLTAQIVPIQSGTGDPSPSNPRPISGTSVLNVTRTGKNLLDYSSTITKEANTVTSTFIADLNFKVGLTYTISATQTPTAGSQTRNTFYLVTPSATTVYGTSDLSIRPMTYTATESGTFKLYLWNHTLDVDVTYSDFQLELGSTATTYEPYTGSTYTVNLGRTIYGGTADVVGGTGENTYGIKDLSTLTWRDYGNNTFYAECVGKNAGMSNLLMSEYSYFSGTYANMANNTFKGATSNAYIYVKDERFSTASDFQERVTSQICYELATPTDFTFTGQPINSYLGVNNLYTDSGEVLDVDYRADIDLLIASLQGNRGLQMMRATPTEENDEQEATENEGER